MENKEIQVVDFENLPIDYSDTGVTEAVLAKLKEDYTVVPDCSTKEGYAIAKAGITLLRTLRIKIEAKRKKNNEKAVDYKKRNDGEAAGYISLIVALEDPMKKEKQAQDAIKEEEKRLAAIKEQERVAAIEKDINTIRNVVLDCHGKDAGELTGIIESLEATEIAVERFAEHTPIAEAAKIEAIQRLVEMRDQALTNEKADYDRKIEDQRLADEREKFKAEQAEAKKKEEAAAIERAKEAQELAEKEEKLRKKQDEELAVERKKLDDEKKETQRKDDIKAKIQGIKDRGAYDPEATSEQIERRINVLKNVTPSKDVYEEFTEDAFMAIGLAISALKDFHAVAVEKERLAAVAAEEAAKAEEEAAKEVETSPKEEKVKETPPDAEFVPEEQVDAVKTEEDIKFSKRMEFVDTVTSLFHGIPTPLAGRLYDAIRDGEVPHVQLIGGETLCPE